MGPTGDNRSVTREGSEKAGETGWRQSPSASPCQTQRAVTGLPTSGSDVKDACILLEPENGSLFRPILRSGSDKAKAVSERQRAEEPRGVCCGEKQRRSEGELLHPHRPVG